MTGQLRDYFPTPSQFEEAAGSFESGPQYTNNYTPYSVVLFNGFYILTLTLDETALNLVANQLTLAGLIYLVNTEKQLEFMFDQNYAVQEYSELYKHNCLSIDPSAPTIVEKAIPVQQTTIANTAKPNEPRDTVAISERKDPIILSQNLLNNSRRRTQYKMYYLTDVYPDLVTLKDKYDTNNMEINKINEEKECNYSIKKLSELKDIPKAILKAINKIHPELDTLKIKQETGFMLTINGTFSLIKAAERFVHERRMSFKIDGHENLIFGNYVFKTQTTKNDSDSTLHQLFLGKDCFVLYGALYELINEVEYKVNPAKRFAEITKGQIPDSIREILEHEPRDWWSSKLRFTPSKATDLPLPFANAAKISKATVESIDAKKRKQTERETSIPSGIEAKKQANPVSTTHNFGLFNQTQTVAKKPQLVPSSNVNVQTQPYYFQGNVQQPQVMQFPMQQQVYYPQQSYFPQNYINQQQNVQPSYQVNIINNHYSVNINNSNNNNSVSVNNNSQQINPANFPQTQYYSNLNPYMQFSNSNNNNHYPPQSNNAVNKTNYSNPKN